MESTRLSAYERCDVLPDAPSSDTTEIESLYVDSSSVSTAQASELAASEKDIIACKYPGVNHTRIQPRKLWVPFFHSKTVLFAFAACFAILAALLCALYAFAKAYQGLAEAHSRQYYLWTYGPTAIFTLMTALWSQVAYRSKQLAPWRTMLYEESSSCPRTVLLDYISPMNPITLFQSMRHKNLDVAITSAGILLLQSTLVLSTNLFLLAQVQVGQPQDLIVTRSFNDSADLSALSTRIKNQTFHYNGSNPANIVLQNLVLDPTFPPGTSSSYAYESFSTMAGPAGYMQARVDGFTSNLACREASIDHSADFSCSIVQVPTSPEDGTMFNVNQSSVQISAPGCRLIGSPQPGDCSVPVDGPYGFAMLGYCNNETAASAFRIAISNTHLSGRTTNASTTVICEVSYSIEQVTVLANVGRDGAATSSEPRITSETTTNRQLANVTIRDLAEHVLNVTEETTSFWEMLLSSVAMNASTLMDVEILANRSNMVFKAIAAQIAQQYLLKPADRPIKGKSIRDEARLQMPALSFGLLEGILAMVLLASLTLVVRVAGRGFAPCDPGSIAGMATIITKSPALRFVLRGSGTYNAKRLATRLDKRIFRSRVTADRASRDTNFEILVDGPGQDEDDIREHPQPIPKWWQPLGASWIAYVSLSLMPLLVVVALELVYQYSETHQGIVKISKSKWEAYAWSYVPALVLLGVRLLYESLSFAALAMQRFMTLKNGTASVHTLRSDPFARFGISNLFLSIRDRRFSITATALATLVAPFLSIAVAGLYYPATATHIVSGFVKPLTGLNFADPPNPVLDFQKIALLSGSDVARFSMSALLSENINPPQWTYNSLVFPVLETELSLDRSQDTERKANLEIAAVRAEMNCTRVTPKVMGYKTGGGNPFHPNNAMVMTIARPPGCEDEDCNSDAHERLFCKADNTTNIWTLGVSYGGESFGGWVSLANDRSIHEGVRPTKCPSFLYLGGMNSDFTQPRVALFQCQPYIALLNVNLEMSLPDYTISPDAPPQVDESSLRLLSTTNPSFNDGSDTIWGGNVFSYPETGPDSTSNLPLMYAKNYDGFVGQVVNGNKRMPPLSQPNNSASERQFLDRTNELYGIWIAQQLNFMSRSVFNTSTNSIRIPANITVAESRLMASAISTRILEGLLAVMWLCGIIAMLLLRTRGILPKNPCTIAAMTSLIADSEMLALIPEGAEWWDAVEMDKQGLFDGYLFSLGWWQSGSDSQSKRYGIDIGRACETS